LARAKKKKISHQNPTNWRAISKAILFPYPLSQFSMERPDFDASRRETASPGGVSSLLFLFLFLFKSKETNPPLVEEQEAQQLLGLLGFIRQFQMVPQF